ncbi:response regulator transcription factor [Paenibacillus sp. FSL R5-0887]|jgi:DNA-binding response OmpR family regulator|uniref:response regulator transcription factor n=1 Tax=Paenibacillus TaxID=44249 RepID=UPI00096E3E16|nr:MULTISPECIES: response regulator transcription factor [Paenibacillus]MDH6427478.1 DNA-binding response OmpR family regulator [Paenibacillus sp. PastH-4]MDH6443508.1 DNA-binding response OmpR family regulator [Paenibacillus sp. PastF-4]MDH6525788.1 DNA-binding response OmpR family regulator [Paenibacillus sp. PastH-3]OMC74507.1 DNA-binding response regulator [Paenibacillus odorifer]OMC80578.1 DNA-binding response regulator [Paenibacillus odorifer]
MQGKVNILICDDNIAVHESISAYLQAENMEYESVYNGEEVLYKLEDQHFDLIILDIMLPGLFGTEVCRKIRLTSNVPIIMLSAKGEETDRILGLEIGADDYITKPFSPREVVTRVKTILKRTHYTFPSEDAILTLGEMKIDRNAFNIKINGSRMEFTPKEIELLIYFTINKNKVLSREQILNKVWGYDYFGDTRAVDNLIKRMRKKLPEKNLGFEIKSVYGMGYKMETST